jgi:spore germination cell wall hydrolase CwlJ-like protein
MKIVKNCLLAVLISCGIQSSTWASIYSPDPWERQIVAACLILEASNQGEKGMSAVANVINNRAGGNPRSIYKEVKKPYAFSALNSASTGKTGRKGYAGHVTRASNDSNWKMALEITDRMYTGTLPDGTRGATHYTQVHEYKSWMKPMQLTVVIGKHKFLRKH